MVVSQSQMGADRRQAGRSKVELWTDRMHSPFPRLSGQVGTNPDFYLLLLLLLLILLLLPFNSKAKKKKKKKGSRWE